jgi:hypothetical protein
VPSPHGKRRTTLTTHGIFSKIEPTNFALPRNLSDEDTAARSKTFGSISCLGMASTNNPKDQIIAVNIPFPLMFPSIGLLRPTPIGDIKLTITLLEVWRSRLQRSALSWVRCSAKSVYGRQA